MVSNCVMPLCERDQPGGVQWAHALFSENNAKSLSHDIIIIGLGAGGFWKIGVTDGASIAGPPADYRHKDCEINPGVQTCFLIHISFIPLLHAVTEVIVSSVHLNVMWMLNERMKLKWKWRHKDPHWL